MGITRMEGASTRAPEAAAEQRQGRRGLRRVAGASIAVLALVAAAGCSGGGDDDERSSATTAPRETTSTTTEGTSTTSTTETTPSTSESGTTTTIRVGNAAVCAETEGWNTNPVSANPGGQADLYRVGAGHHECYDRITFNVNEALPGDAEIGYDVRYMEGEVSADASGEPVPTAGPVAMQVVVRAPAQGYNPNSEGHQPGVKLAPEVGADLWSTSQLEGRDIDTFQQVAFAGSFEGQSNFAVGLDEQRPFRVDAQEYPGRTVVYVDVAVAP
jgi:hypothetical protein